MKSIPCNYNYIKCKIHVFALIISSTVQFQLSSLYFFFILANDSGHDKAFRFKGHTDAVLCISFSPSSGRLIASSSRDKTVRIWTNSAQGDSIDFRGHSGSVRSVEFSPQGDRLLTASDDKTVKLWTVQRHKFVASIVGHTNWVRCAR